MPAFCILMGAVAAVLIAHDTRQRVFVHPADEANPYAYAHTSEDLLGLPAEIAKLAQQDALASPRIAVIASDPWPLPWYLRHFSEVGFWQPGQHAGNGGFLHHLQLKPRTNMADQLQGFRPEFFGAPARRADCFVVARTEMKSYGRHPPIQSSRHGDPL